MNRENLYHQSYELLTTAYVNGELRHEDCSSCAVGTLLKQTAYENGLDNALWRAKFLTTFCPKENRYVQRFNEPVFNGYLGDKSIGKVLNEEFKVAGVTLLTHAPYHWKELARIEFAFENVEKRKVDEDYDPVFAGLVAVLKELEDIHEVEHRVFSTLC